MNWFTGWLRTLWPHTRLLTRPYQPPRVAASTRPPSAGTHFSWSAGRGLMVGKQDTDQLAP